MATICVVVGVREVNFQWRKFSPPIFLKRIEQWLTTDHLISNAREGGGVFKLQFRDRESGAHDLHNEAGRARLRSRRIGSTAVTTGGTKKRARKFNNQLIGNEIIYLGSEGMRKRQGPQMQGETRSSWRNEDKQERTRQTQHSRKNIYINLNVTFLFNCWLCHRCTC